MTAIECSSQSAHRRAVGRRLALAGACVVSTATLCFADQQPSPATAPAPLSYQAAVRRALDANPRIVAARLRRAANVASRDVAAERLNPEFRAAFAKETPKEGYTLAVPMERGGKRARRIEVADAIIVTGDAELSQVIAEVQAEVRRAYFARVVAENRQMLLDDMRTLAERARDAAQARFDAGGVPR